MLTVLVVFVCAALAWGFARSRGRTQGEARERSLRRALEALAEASGLRVDDTDATRAPVLRGSARGVDLRVEPGTRGLPFDGDVAIVASCPSGGRLVVWPRDPPDEIIEGLGQERPTNDPAFDARFAVLGTPAELAVFLHDPEIGPSLYALGIVALLIERREATLFLPGVPDVDSLRQATALIARVVTAMR